MLATKRGGTPELLFILVPAHACWWWPGSARSVVVEWCWSAPRLLPPSRTPPSHGAPRVQRTAHCSLDRCHRRATLRRKPRRVYMTAAPDHSPSHITHTLLATPSSASSAYTHRTGVENDHSALVHATTTDDIYIAKLKWHQSYTTCSFLVVGRPV